MSVTGFIVLAVIVVMAGYGAALYNSLVSLKHSVSKAWSNIDVLLKRRHDELPKLVETCKQYTARATDLRKGYAGAFWFFKCAWHVERLGV
jgi:hypothetical protein